MQPQFQLINKNSSFEKEFSICTIVTHQAEYQTMMESFISKGFDSTTEYLCANNIDGNHFDAYEAIRIFLKEGKGKYKIIVHQDVRCVDTIDVLRQCIEALDQLDHKWAIAGNAGGAGYKKIYYHLNNHGDIRKSKNLPKQVYSLDENFLLIKSESQLSVSADIQGFHFYGTDLCINADFLGYHSYVMPFLVEHLSKGNLKALEETKPDFINLYGRKLRGRFMQTSCTKFYLSNAVWKNKLINHPLVFFFVKPFTRLFNILKGH